MSDGVSGSKWKDISPFQDLKTLKEEGGEKKESH